MKTKNTTPFPFGTKITSRLPPQLEMTAIVRGTFSLKPGEDVAPLSGVGFPQGFLTADTYREEDEDRTGECLSASDFADFKLHADLTFKGTCYPAGSRAAQECPVEIAVGGWSKRLRVIGRRVWTESVLGGAISQPAPFVDMPLGYANAFGGPTHPQNPVGKGLDTAELPTVEIADAPLRGRGDRPPTAGIGPLNPAWLPRSGKLGKEYGKKWKAERAPFYAEDFDWTYFNAAPADQQLQGYLRGDESLRFTHLHPKASTFEARLPSLRIRVFVKDTEGAFREVRMNLDTLHADLDEGTLTLTWRGLDKVRDPDLKDIAFAFVASEPLGEKPLPAAHYQARMAEFEADPLGFKDHLPPDMAGLADQFNEQRKAYEAGKPLPLSVSSPPLPANAGQDPVSALLQQKLGSAAPDVQAKVRASMGSVDKAQKVAGPAKPGTDLQAMIAKAVADRAGAAKFAPAASLAPGALPRVPLGSVMARMKAAAETIKKLAAEKSLKIEGLDKLEAATNDPRLKALDPTLGKPPKPDVEPGPGADLEGRDFAGWDLRGCDLRGANLEGALLSSANLAGVSLAGANLAHAVLLEANLERANLENANLSMANLSKVVANGAIFDGANLDQANLTGGRFGGASFEKAHGSQTVLVSANLEKARARGCSFEQSDFEGANLEDADFKHAKLVRCLLSRMDAARVDMEQAVLTRSSFALSRLEQARFVQASGELTFWEGAKLDRADFSYAIAPRSHFTDASAQSTSFFAADLSESRFYRAKLDQAGFVRCNLLHADLCRSVLNGTRFNDSNLYDAKFLGAGGAGCDFAGANLKTSTLENA